VERIPVESPNSKRPPLKTLLVEDNVEYRGMLAELLHARFPEIEIYEADDGGAAIDCVQMARPDLIFMDIQLSGDNGLQVTQNIKKIDATVEVVILSNMDIPEYRQAAFRLGADSYICKGSSSCKIDIIARTEATLRKCLQPH
jgi:DNA-binding NarL/FixJ family response regulator